MTFTRKEFLKLGLVRGAGLVLPSSASPAWGRANGTTGCLLRSKAQLPKPSMIPLHVPPVLEPVRIEEGIDFYEMTQKPGRAEILPGLWTEIWGYDGIFPGPTIVSRSGRKNSNPPAQRAARARLHPPARRQDPAR